MLFVVFCMLLSVFVRFLSVFRLSRAHFGFYANILRTSPTVFVCPLQYFACLCMLLPPFCMDLVSFLSVLGVLDRVLWRFLLVFGRFWCVPGLLV